MGILRKIQSQPERIKKLFLWLMVIIIGFGLITGWAENLQQKLKSFRIERFKQELKIPSFGGELKEIPKLEMPKIIEGELKKLEEELKQESDEKK